ncbi:hypothetical protein [Terasakiella pusilla]|uniref:hypothetical protein n=1 Tax=Terasakiella pusilla TaxID=64973 RepID=UPI00048FF3C9|nr:hypothetical protein [Terasakiella pusilla]
MIFKEGSAQDVHNWFVSEKTPEVALCIFLGAAKQEISILSSLIDNCIEIDSIIGNLIGFLLCGNNISAQSSFTCRNQQNFIAAEYKKISNKAVPVRDYLSRIDAQLSKRKDNYRKEEIASFIANSSARLVPDFIDLYGVSQKELPCMITLIKGIDKTIVTPFPARFTSDHFIQWLSQIRDLVDNVDRHLLSPDFYITEVSELINKNFEYENELRAKLQKIKKAAIGISGKYQVPVDDALPMISVLTSQRQKSKEKAEYIQNFILKYPKSETDNRWQKIASLQKKVDQLLSLQNDIITLNNPKDASERLEVEYKKLHLIYDQISNLKFEFSNSRTVKITTSDKIWKPVERVNTTSDLLKKLHSIYEKGPNYLSKLISNWINY